MNLDLDDTVNIDDNHHGSVTIYWHQCKDEGYWTFQNADGWDWLGSSSGGGLERRFPEECQYSGPGKNIKKQLELMVPYFEDLNKKGSGRYDLHACIKKIDEEYGDFTDQVFEKNIIIDNNRELDSDVFDVPYNPNCKMNNYNFLK